MVFQLPSGVSAAAATATASPSVSAVTIPRTSTRVFTMGPSLWPLYTTGMANDTSISEYWERDGLGRAILDARAAAGKRLDVLTVDDLAPTDHFHGGGLDATLRLARLAGLDRAPVGTRVLDVGGGIG